MATEVKVMSDSPRFGVVTRDSLDAEGQRVWDKRVKTVNVPTGHFNVMMNVPALHECIHDLEQFFRTGSSIAEPDREFITLVVAREGEARFAWQRHETRAKERGVSADAVEKVRAKAPLEGFEDKYRLLVELARAMAGTRTDLPLELYERVRKERGERWAIEAIALCAHYTMVGVLIHGFGVEQRPNDPPTF
jgi:alkylhydroperoxidase family enzyme